MAQFMNHKLRRARRARRVGLSGPPRGGLSGPCEPGPAARAKRAQPTRQSGPSKPRLAGSVVPQAGTQRQPVIALAEVYVTPGPSPGVTDGVGIGLTWAEAREAVQANRLGLEPARPGRRAHRPNHQAGQADLPV